jgi:hypothetical protein
MERDADDADWMASITMMLVDSNDLEQQGLEWM